MSSSSCSSSSGKRKLLDESSLGVPFSIDFIRSQQQSEGQEHPRQKSVRTKDRCSACVFRYAKSNDNSKCLVSVVPGTDLYLSGAARVTFLKGPPLYVNGYRLKAGETEHVVISCWMPAGCIKSCLEGETTTKSSSKRQSINVLLKSYGITYACDTIEDLDKFFGQATSILLIEGVDAADMEWLEAAENFPERMQYLKQLAGTVDTSLSNFVFLGSVVVGSQAGFAGIGADIQQIASGWEQAVRALLEDNPRESKKVVICGAKGVGKSTCLRYTLNRLLSRYGAVAVIDCDVGQPELFLPGFLSLHIVKKPVLSAGHLNIIPADFSYFIGDVSTKSNPDLAMAAVRQLFANYEELRDSYQTRHLQRTKSAPSNMYAVLAQDDDDDDDDDDGTNDSLLPMLVNTDGWVRYMGAEILKNIISVVAPTHLFHVLSARGTDLLDAALILPAQSELLKLDPGRSIPGKVAATDLRTLRLVSYFLRSSVYINNLSKGNLQDFPISLRSGSLVDPTGIIARALSMLDSVVAPLDSVNLRYMSDVSINLSFALFNASLVGIMTASVESGAQKTFGYVTPGGTKRTFTCNCSREYTLSPCLGLGIVKFIDISAPNLALIVPENEKFELLKQDSRTVLVRGIMQLPVVMVYSPTFPFLPYQTGELAGEGLSCMKARNNVKRKG